MKKGRKLALLPALALLLCLLPAEAGAVHVSAQSAIVIECGTGEALFEENAHERLPMASTTKIMTALAVLENCSLDEKVTVKKEYTNVEGSSMYLQEGEVLTVEELLYGLMLSSGNDAATALACCIAGDEASFAELMNEKAGQLGLADTHFENPHGLSAEGHYSTAADMARLTAYAMENEDFVKIVSAKTRTIGARSLKNHNKLLWMYEGIIGVKTGYTKDSGRCLVSCAERNGMRLVCVTLNDRNDWDDHMAMYDEGFTNYHYVDLGGEGVRELQVVSGEKASVMTARAFEFGFLAGAEDVVEIKTELPEFLYAPVSKGSNVGKITVTVNGQIKKEVPIVCSESVALDSSVPLTLREKIIRGWRMANKYGYKGSVGIYGP